VSDSAEEEILVEALNQVAEEVDFRVAEEVVE
jgi:hypothetical protein